MEDPDFASVSVEHGGENSMVRVQAEKYGETTFCIQDGEKSYRYTLRISEDDTGHPQVEIVPLD